LFKEVTSIEEAIQCMSPSPLPCPLFEEHNANVVLVWEKTKQDRRVRQMAEENKIEMEDDEGNVMSAKTYNDLKAQGII